MIYVRNLSLNQNKALLEDEGGGGWGDSFPTFLPCISGPLDP